MSTRRNDSDLCVSGSTYELQGECDMINTLIISGLFFFAGLGIGWALGFESCAHMITDEWADADWQEVQSRD